MEARVLLDPSSLHGVQGDPVAAPVMELRRARGGVIGQLPDELQRSVVLQVNCDPRTPEGVIADLLFHARRDRPPPRQGVGAVTAVPVGTKAPRPSRSMGHRRQEALRRGMSSAFGKIRIGAGAFHPAPWPSVGTLCFRTGNRQRRGGRVEGGRSELRTMTFADPWTGGGARAQAVSPLRPPPKRTIGGACPPSRPCAA